MEMAALQRLEDTRRIHLQYPSCDLRLFLVEEITGAASGVVVARGSRPASHDPGVSAPASGQATRRNNSRTGS